MPVTVVLWKLTSKTEMLNLITQKVNLGYIQPKILEATCCTILAYHHAPIPKAIKEIKVDTCGIERMAMGRHTVVYFFPGAPLPPSGGPPEPGWTRPFLTLSSAFFTALDAKA